MLTPFLHKTVLSFALAVFLSSNLGVFPLSSVDCNEKEDTTTTYDDTKPSIASSSVVEAARITLPFRQYDTANDIPKAYFKDKRVIRGKVIKVIDGDTIRIRHTPLYPLSKGEKGCTDRKLSECTISVRLYGVDAPETPKFGNEGQPYAQEAKEYVSKQVYDKNVKIKLLRKDQYSRVIGSVTSQKYKYIPFIKTDLSQGLAANGYASLYTGGGSEYNGNIDKLNRKIKRAQNKKRGIWSNGVDGFVDPATYKKEVKEARRNGER